MDYAIFICGTWIMFHYFFFLPIKGRFGPWLI